MNRVLAGLIVGMAFFSGCSRDEIRVYTVPASDGSAPASERPSEEAAPAGNLAWTAPIAWEQRQGGSLRLASFGVHGVSADALDISVVSFPGTGGDDLANLNRWRGQIGLGPADVSAVAGGLKKIHTQAGDFTQADFSTPGGEGKALVGGWLRSQSKVWFIKMVGTQELVKAQRKAFDQFVSSLTLGATAASQPVVTEGPDEGMGFAWSKPSAWSEGTAGSMIKAAYVTSHGAKVSVSAFPGDVGGLLANVNRWRSQLGLAEIGESALAGCVHEFPVAGRSLTVVDLQSDGADPQRIEVALAMTAGRTWFFKLVGPVGATAAADDEFKSFLASIHESPSK